MAHSGHIFVEFRSLLAITRVDRVYSARAFDIFMKPKWLSCLKDDMLDKMEAINRQKCRCRSDPLSAFRFVSPGPPYLTERLPLARLTRGPDQLLGWMISALSRSSANKREPDWPCYSWVVLYNNSRSWRTCLMTRFFRLFRKFIPFSVIISLSISSQIANLRIDRVESCLDMFNVVDKSGLCIDVAVSSASPPSCSRAFAQLVLLGIKISCPAKSTSWLGETSTATSSSSQHDGSQHDGSALGLSSCADDVVSLSRAFFRRLE